MDGNDRIGEREADEFVRRYAAERFGEFRCASLIIDLGNGLPHDIRVVLPATAPGVPSQTGAS